MHVKRLNLLGEWPLNKQFDVIFCRNVMIYFDQPTKDRLVARLCGPAFAGGHLSISVIASGLQARRRPFSPQVGSTIYRKGRM